MCLLPGLEMRKEGTNRFFVANEIVVDEIDMPAIAERIEGIEFGQHLRRCLGPWHPSIEFDDVAELTGERASARKLHAHEQIILELQKIEARDRRLGNVHL